MGTRSNKETRLRVWSGSTPPPTDVCYVWNFDINDPFARIEDISWNGGATSAPINSDVGNTEVQIQADIEDALNGVPITYTSVIVVKTDLGGGVLNFTITIKNPDVVFFLIHAAGNPFSPIINDCR